MTSSGENLNRGLARFSEALAARRDQHHRSAGQQEDPFVRGLEAGCAMEAAFALELLYRNTGGQFGTRLTDQPDLTAEPKEVS
jgi:hypothetical protein